MIKAEATVKELVDKIERGELRLPEIQRRYVWNSTRVRDLFDSLYRGYPSGTILLWEPNREVPLQKFSVGQQEDSWTTKQLLLDGQQRLTSLSAVIRGEPVTVRGRRRPIELLFNLDHPEDLTEITEVNENSDEDEERNEDEIDSTEDEWQKRLDRMTFVVGTQKLKNLSHWVNVSKVLNSTSSHSILKDAGLSDFHDPRIDKYDTRLTQLRKICDYAYRLDILESTLSYDEVTEIFVRVNSLGAKLRSSDLALAQITAKWRGALKIFQDFQEECKDSGFDLELGIHLKNLVVFATGQSRFHTVGGLPRKELEVAWEKCVEGMNFALNFLKNNTSIDNPALLSSPFLVVALGYYLHENNYELSSEGEKWLRRWALVANAKGRYSRGSSETLLDQDLATIREGGGPKEMLERLHSQVGRLDITPEDLEGLTQRSALFKTMFLVFRSEGATDWHSNLKINLDHRGAKHRLQFHHIFPKAILKRSGHTAREADDIANLAFIGGKTNRQISDKAPKKYFPRIIQKSGIEPLKAQCIPTDEPLLDEGEYKKFLAERRRLVSQRLNKFLKIE